MKLKELNKLIGVAHQGQAIFVAIQFYSKHSDPFRETIIIFNKSKLIVTWLYYGR